MVKPTPLTEIDVVTPEDVLDLAAHRGPCVSVFLPTARHGPETTQGPLRLKNLFRQVAADLAALHGADTVDQILDPLRGLVDTANFWQHQVDGLALYGSADRHHSFRVPLAFAESAVAGTRFRLRPLLPLIVGDDAFFIVALTQNSVRVFEATRQTIDELPTDSFATSIDEALAHEDPERQLQSRSVGGGNMQFHGHGGGGEVDKATLERYFRAVDRGLTTLLGSTRQPVVLACVDYYLPIYRSVTKLANVADAAVTGNPEHRAPAELHARALEVVATIQAARRTAVTDRFGSLAGTGAAVTSIDEITSAAAQGRIDTLLLQEAAPHLQPETDTDTDTDTDTEALVDEIVADVLTTGGAVHTAALDVALDIPVAAILRY